MIRCQVTLKTTRKNVRSFRASFVVKIVIQKIWTFFWIIKYCEKIYCKISLICKWTNITISVSETYILFLKNNIYHYLSYSTLFFYIIFFYSYWASPFKKEIVENSFKVKEEKEWSTLNFGLGTRIEHLAWG